MSMDVNGVVFPNKHCVIGAQPGMRQSSNAPQHRFFAVNNAEEDVGKLGEIAETQPRSLQQHPKSQWLQTYGMVCDLPLLRGQTGAVDLSSAAGED